MVPNGRRITIGSSVGSTVVRKAKLQDQVIEDGDLYESYEDTVFVPESYAVEGQEDEY